MPATPATAATATPPAPASATAPGVSLAEAAERVQSVIAAGAREGITHARIQLAPESLGGIQIHLQHTPDGIVARVVAEHADAARTLAQGGDDLRRSLQQNGAHLLRLDIESSDRRQPGGAQGQGGNGRSSTAGDDEPATDGDAVAAAPADTPTHSLASSALVNVLA